MKVGKSCKICLTNHTRPILHHITPLVINALRADTQTDTHTDVKQKLFQETRRTQLKVMHAWVKNF